MIGIERVARLAVRSAVYEALYLGSASTVSTPLRTALTSGLLELYIAVLKFLSCAKTYCVQSTTSRLFYSPQHEISMSLFNVFYSSRSSFRFRLGGRKIFL
jgi:hypothetical protein